MPATLSPSEARFILESIGLPALRLEHGLTRRVVGAIPRERMDFRPAAGARSAGDLARHIVGAELQFLSGAAMGSFADFTTELGNSPDPGSVVSLYEVRFALLLTQLSAARGQDLLRELDYRGHVRMPALGFVQFALNHTIHHRGQLSVYLRAVEVKVPPIYG